jgi:Transposase DDE domain/Domain of unknown function (DUF4372)
MDKSNNSSGIHVFGQLISLLPKQRIVNIIRQHQSDRYTKKFKTWDHLVVMLFASLSNCTALREIESGIAGFHTKLLHLSMSWLPRRSTLSDANAQRSAEVFEAIFEATYTHVRPFLPDSLPKSQLWLQKLFLIDSTTITLFKAIMKASGCPQANGKRKGGVKIHIGMQLSENTPSVVRITPAAASDSQFMSRFKDIQPGTILVFDKAYVNYKLYNHWTKNEVDFVTRLHGNCSVNVLQEISVSEDQQMKGVCREQMVELGYSAQKERVRCRLIFIYDKAKNKVFKFITNNTELEASQIAEIYKQRWQIELLFKRLKQNLQLSSFLGDNENAIRIQIWCNLIADLLLTVIRKGLNKTKAYSNVAGLIRLHLMNYVKIADLLLKPGDYRIFTTQLGADNRPPPSLFE